MEARFSNRGRWGEDDEIRALNLITPEKRLEAVAPVREGLTLLLAVDANAVEAIGNPDPSEHTMLGIGAHRTGGSYYGMAHTQIDAMAQWQEGRIFYNGCAPGPEPVLENGHGKNSVHNLKGGS